MTTPDRPPDFPYPVPPGPGPPVPAQPPSVPLVDVPGGDARGRLLDRRTVMVTGRLDRAAANELCAQLMALDGESGRDVEVIVNSEGGPLSEILAVLDVLGPMRAAVNTTCIGAARGTAGVVVACGTGERRIGPSASVSLRCDQVERIEGSAEEIRGQAQQLATTRDRVIEALVARTGMGRQAVADELERGGWHDAEEAPSLGIVDLVRT